MSVDAAPVEIKLFNADQVTGAKGSEIMTIGRAQQVDDASWSVNQTFLELFTQESALPNKRISQGQEFQATFSVSDIHDLELFALVTNQSVREDTVDNTKKLVLGLANSGATPPLTWVEIRPYEGNAVSTDENKLIGVPAAQFIAESVEIAQGLQTQNKYNVQIFGVPSKATIDGQTGMAWFRGDQTVSS